jgi:hypothetical protein
MSTKSTLSQNKIIIKKEKLKDGNVIDDKSMTCNLNDKYCHYDLNGKKGEIKKNQILKKMFSLDKNKNIVEQILDSPLNINVPMTKLGNVRNPTKHIKVKPRKLMDFDIFTQHQHPNNIKNKNLINILTQNLDKQQIKMLTNQFDNINSDDDVFKIDLNRPVCQIKQQDLSTILEPVSKMLVAVDKLN